MSTNTTATQQLQQNQQTHQHQQTQQNQQAQQTQQTQVQTNAQLQANAQADDTQMSPAEARELYRQQTKHMKDGVKFGRRPFKAKSAAQEKAETFAAGEDGFKVKNLTADSKNTYLAGKYASEQQAEMKKNGDATELMDRLINFHFTPQMFVSSEIRAHLKEYLLLVRTYEVLHDTLCSRLTPEQQAQLDQLEPLMDQLRHRLKVYCEKNGVTVGGAWFRGSWYNKDQYSLTKDEIEKWYDTVQEYNRTRYTTTPTDAQRKAHRAGIAAN